MSAVYHDTCDAALFPIKKNNLKTNEITGETRLCPKTARPMFPALCGWTESGIRGADLLEQSADSDLTGNEFLKRGQAAPWPIQGRRGPQTA